MTIQEAIERVRTALEAYHLRPTLKELSLIEQHIKEQAEQIAVQDRAMRSIVKDTTPMACIYYDKSCVGCEHMPYYGEKCNSARIAAALEAAKEG